MPALSEGHTILVAGKIVLAGEYAVLDGCPSLVLAINRGVGCHIREGSGISTPNGDTSFVAPFLADHANSKRYEFFDWNPVVEFGKDKPGFGGSAAACVAACIAAGEPPQKAFSVHHTVQGSGSGIDIAASIHGGLIEFTSGQCTQKSLLSPLIIWSGTSAKTGPRVQQYLSWKEREAFITECRQLICNFADNPIHTISELYLLLSKMAEQAHISYNTPNIKNIVQLVKNFGGAAKPSGAGGGDCVIALFPTQDALLEFQRQSPFPSILAEPAPSPQIITQ